MGRQRIETAVAEACTAAGVRRESIVSVFVGMAGVTTQEARDVVAKRVASCGLGRATVGVDHDIRVALAGGLAGAPGIALIVGTGSSCYGRTKEGRTWQTGGWESLIADEGSGYYLGREAIAAAARMADGRLADTGLREAVFGWLGIREVSELLQRLHASDMTRTDIAALAPRVIERAEAGDSGAMALLERGADLLAELVEANHRMLPTGPGPDVVIAGGVGSAPTVYRSLLERSIRRRLEGVRICVPAMSPVAGAVLLAMEQAGGTGGAGWMERIREFENPVGTPT